MEPEEKDTILSAYLDGELEPERAAQLEAELENDLELQERLHQMSVMGEHIRDHLRQEAEAQDFTSMRAAVMQAVQAETQPLLESNEDSWLERSIDSVLQLFRQPAMSFALGAVLVLGAWAVLQTVEPPSESSMTTDMSAEMPLRSQQTSIPAEKGAQTPDLVVDELETHEGTLELRTRPDDPEAPTVLWYVAKGGIE